VISVKSRNVVGGDRTLAAGARILVRIGKAVILHSAQTNSSVHLRRCVSTVKYHSDVSVDLGKVI